jgi:hypothetical protein
MAAKDFALQHDRFFDPAFAKSQGRNRLVTVYHMRALDDGDSAYKRWTNDGSPDISGTGENAPTPVGTLTDIIVERREERTTPAPRKNRLIHAWNETDLSQLTLVAGNGVGGVGVAGDWTLAFDSFPSDDAPALKFTNNNANTNAALWLFNDFLSPLPELFSFTYRNLLETGGAADFGLILYYEATDNYFGVRRAGLNGVSLLRQDAGGHSLQKIGRLFDLPSANRDVTYGELVAGTVRIQQATSSAKPWMSGRMGGEALSGWGESALTEVHRAGGFTQASANASWLGLGSYTPRLGVLVYGAGATGDEYAGGIAFLNAYGGV